MKRLVLLALLACGEPPTFEYTLDEGGAPAPPAAPAAQEPAAPAPEPGPGAADAGGPGDGFEPPLERAVEPPRPGHLRVLVLSGGGYHEFAANLSALLQGLEARASLTLTELVLHPAENAAPTSRRALEEADLAAEYDVILAYTQGELGFTETMKSRLLDFVRGGGGLVALHSAADSHPGWAGWDDLLRGRFESHPPYGDVLVQVCDLAHPVVAGLPAEWALRDEFYHLKDCAWDDKRVIMVGTSPAGGELRPVTWVRDHGAGRVVYTILGHGLDTHRDARYQQLVAQALAWAAGADAGAAGPR